ncbi:MAG: DUF192 domain-containing protein [Bdellovibrionota bacterium]
MGLLGKKSLNPDEGLWITPCYGIHTWFMRFPLDCVFVDRDCKVIETKSDVKPWRIVMPVKGAHSVFEFSAGWLAAHPVQKGDQLNVLR